MNLSELSPDRWLGIRSLQRKKRVEMTDRYSGHAKSLSSPADHGFPISPSDSLDLTEPTRAIYVGTGGNLAVTLLSGAELTLANIPTGSIVPIRIRRIKATNTTATNLVGLV